MKRFLTFDLLIHLSDRDFSLIISEVDKTIVLHAYKNAPSSYLEKVRRALADSSLGYFEKDLASVGDVKDEDIVIARDRIVEVADRLLIENEFEDWRIRRA